MTTTYTLDYVNTLLEYMKKIVELKRDIMEDNRNIDPTQLQDYRRRYANLAQFIHSSNSSITILSETLSEIGSMLEHSLKYNKIP